MIPIAKIFSSGTNGDSFSSCPVNSCGHIRRQHLYSVKVNGILCSRNGKCNMNPFSCCHIYYSTIIPYFSSTSPDIQFYSLFIGISFPEQPESCCTVIYTASDNQNTCSVGASINFIPECSAEFLAK